VGGDCAPIPDTNIGKRMLEQMGWRPGEGLGADGGGIQTPVTATLRPYRQGLGCEGPGGSGVLAGQTNSSHSLTGSLLNTPPSSTVAGSSMVASGSNLNVGVGVGGATAGTMATTNLTASLTGAGVRQEGNSQES